MSAPRDLEDLKRMFDRTRLEQLAESEGLVVRNHRSNCPAGCANDKRRVAFSDENGVGLWHCHGCDVAGTAIDLLMHTRKASSVEAIRVLEELANLPPPPKRARPETPKKDGKALWEKLATSDKLGEQYLASRGLEGAVVGGLVRFNTGNTGDEWLDKKARLGYRVAFPFFDAAGELVSFQLRAVGVAEPSKLSLFTISTDGLAFGCTAEARTAPRVFLTEGLADTLALLLAGECTVGADGEGKLRWAPSFLGHVKGREIVLCPQNDKHEKSQLAFGALEKVLRKAGAVIRVLTTPEAYKDPAEWLADVGLDAFKAAVESSVKAVVPPSPAKAAAGQPPATGGKGPDQPERPMLPTLTNSYASCCEVFRNPKIRETVLGPGELEFNEQTLTPCIGRRPLRDEDLGRVRELVERHYRSDNNRPVKLAAGDLQQAVLQVSREKSFHPVAEYLRGLQWDGVRRIEHLATEVLGIEREGDRAQPLAPIQLRKWMIAAVARALQPGCKVDTVLVFTGSQGLLKSSFFRVMAGADWFSDAPVDMHDKDSRLLLRRCWVLEWAELDALQRASSTAVKAFITTQIDQVRPPYARGISDFPRTCIIVGTTNQETFLSDPTGSRRYWVIELTRLINLDLLRSWRDQLWAEATAAYLAGEQWHLDREEEQELASRNRVYEEADAWEELVLRWAEKQVAAEFSVAEVLRNAVNKDPKDWTRRDQNRVADILKRAGWTQGKRIRNADGQQVRMWQPPSKGAAA